MKSAFCNVDTDRGRIDRHMTCMYVFTLVDSADQGQSDLVGLQVYMFMQKGKMVTQPVCVHLSQLIKGS